MSNFLRPVGRISRKVIPPAMLRSAFYRIPRRHYITSTFSPTTHESIKHLESSDEKRKQWYVPA